MAKLWSVTIGAGEGAAGESLAQDFSEPAMMTSSGVVIPLSGVVELPLSLSTTGFFR